MGFVSVLTHTVLTYIERDRHFVLHRFGFCVTMKVMEMLAMTDLERGVYLSAKQYGI